MNNWLVRFFTNSFILLTIQILVLNHLNLSGLINPYIYPLCIIILPLSTNKGFILLSGFIIGLCVDLFQHSYGMHAASMVFIAFIRPYLLRLFNPKEQEVNELMDPYYHGMVWYLIYTGCIIFMHTFLFLMIEMGTFNQFGWTLLRVLVSASFAILLIWIYLMLTFRKTRKKYS